MDYTVRRIPGGVGKAFIIEHHYSHGCHNGPMTWGLFSGEELIGVCAFATPGSEAVRASLFGKEHKDHVTELHRLVIVDDTPKNTESWFISRALKGLKTEKPNIWAVISFADSSEGHVGTIYQATNALYLGTTTNGARFYRDETGRLRHPRQNGHNVTLKEAIARGWTAERRGLKHRYVFLTADSKVQRKKLLALLAPRVQDYPKIASNTQT